MPRAQQRTDLSRERSSSACGPGRSSPGGTIAAQMRRLGASVDWSRERFTMDAGLSRAVLEAFVRLHEQGLIYRGQRLVNWDPQLRTALSDLEVLSDRGGGPALAPALSARRRHAAHVVVATTRPETMLGDVAVAVHPDDERYRH